MAKKQSPTWKDVTNNFLIRIISSGQLPFLAMLGILALLIWRTPPDNIVEVWRILQKTLDRKSGLGYSLAALSAGGWVVQSKLQRRKTECDMERMANERNEAQQLHFKDKLGSSRK